MHADLHPFALAFIAATLASLALELWLARRQARHVRAHRDAVPAAFAASVSAAEHAKAADYARARLAVGAVELGLGALLALGWTLGGGIAALDAAWRGAAWGPVATGTAVILSLFMLNAALELPLSLWRTFGVETRFGFNRMGPGLFLADLAKGLALAFALGAPLAAAALWLMTAAGPAWWLWVWALWSVFTLAISWAYPRFIAPLFNRFSPLPDGELKSRLEALIARCGFESRGLSVMDGSRRSAHGNAYFTGFGAAKRIVLFDTLVERLRPDEVEAVLAHELGHFRLRHVTQRLLASLALSFAALALLGWLAAQPWFHAALGVPTSSAHATLLLFAIALPPFAALLAPLGAAWSRRHEFEADAYAVRHADGAALARALIALYRENASTLTPDPLYVAFHYSHPPAADRIARLAAAR